MRQPDTSGPLLLTGLEWSKDGGGLTIEDIVDQSVNKALDQFDLGVELNLFQRWTGNEEREKAKSGQ